MKMNYILFIKFKLLWKESYLSKIKNLNSNMRDKDLYLVRKINKIKQ